MADREIIDSLKKYTMLLNAEGISVNKAYLFRSYSDDTALEESDILIVYDKYDENDDFTKGWIEKIKE